MIISSIISFNAADPEQTTMQLALPPNSIRLQNGPGRLSRLMLAKLMSTNIFHYDCIRAGQQQASSRLLSAVSRLEEKPAWLLVES
jgi:hypothetical protein